MTSTMVTTYLRRWHALQSALMGAATDEITGEPIYINSNLKVRPVIQDRDGTPDANPEIRCTIFVACPVGNMMDMEIQHVLQIVEKFRDDEMDDPLHGVTIEINNGGIEIKDMLLD